MSFQPSVENMYMVKPILPMMVASLICLSSQSVMAEDNQSTAKSPEKFLSTEEIDKLMSIHFPDEWKSKQNSQEKQKKLEKIAENNKLDPNKKQQNLIQDKKPVSKSKNSAKVAKNHNPIVVRLVTQGKTPRERLAEQRATDVQKMGVNTKYTYNPKLYTMFPEHIGKIQLMSRITRYGFGPLRLYRNNTNKLLADGFFKYHQTHSELFSAYLARKITLNGGVIGDNITLHKAFVNEITYKFAQTPVLSANSAKDAEEKYLYIQLRLTPSDRVQFWKYINTMREGNVVSLPKGLTIADVLTADL